MDSRLDVPVYLECQEDGTVSASCPSLSCHCNAPSRADALTMIDQLVRTATFRAAAHPAAPAGETYEIVFLAISSANIHATKARRAKG
ncbi:hypothetical protein LZC95_04865 [Pendulispora brunnea]|uniref:Uncharacterized protein n=1 Tax=Pendulispora brunnea TaxID=2905690 RepID=A0ABZ2KBX8_9BACT